MRQRCYKAESSRCPVTPLPHAQKTTADFMTAYFFFDFDLKQSFTSSGVKSSLRPVFGQRFSLPVFTSCQILVLLSLVM